MPHVRLPPVKKDQGYWLRLFRATNNISQQGAALRFGISPSHWSRLEDGNRIPGAKLATKLARATGVPVETFLKKVL